jgi:hypothetical protein
MRIIGATLTFEDTFHGNPLYGYYDEVKEKKRPAVNEWIRKSGAFDGLISRRSLFEIASRAMPANHGSL